MKFDVENKGSSLVLTYKLEDNEELDKFCYGMLVNNKMDGIANISFTQKNDEKYMMFSVAVKTCLQDGFQGFIGKDKLLRVFDSLNETLLNAENYGITYSSFLLDPEHIYLDTKNIKTILLCVPITSYENETNPSGFYLSLLGKVQADTQECYDCIQKLGSFATDADNFSLIQFRDLIDALLGRPSRVPQKKENVPEPIPDLPAYDPAGPAQEHFVMGPDQGPPSAMPPVVKKRSTAEPNAPQAPAEQFAVPGQEGGFAIPGGGSMTRASSKPGKKAKENASAKTGSAAENTGEKKTVFSVIKAILRAIFIKKEPAEKQMPAAPAIPSMPPAAPPRPAMPAYPAVPPVQPTRQPAPPVQPPVQPVRQPVPPVQPPVQPVRQPVPPVQPPVQPSYQPAPPAPQPVQPLYQPVPPVQPPVQPSYQPAPPAPQPVQPSQPPAPRQTPPRPAAPFAGKPAGSGDSSGGHVEVIVTNQNGEPIKISVDGLKNASVPPSVRVVPNSMESGGTTVLSPGATTVLMDQLCPKLVRVKTGEEVYVNKPVFRIGKEKSYVDYFISDNPAISRSHANIVIRDGEYYIVDTNSTNHTFIEDKLIQSNVEYKIIYGTRIKMADEYFVFSAGNADTTLLNG